VGWVDFKETDYFSLMKLRTLDRVSQLALIAAREAMEQAALSNSLGDEAGVYLGTGMGGANTLETSYARFFGVGGEDKKPITIPIGMNHAAAAQISMAYGVTGECQTYSTACSSSAVAIGEAYRRIRSGIMTTAIAGGTECQLTPGVLKQWMDMRVMCVSDRDDPRQCQPFCADRSGFTIGEGAGILVLERLEHALARGATPLAEVVGYGVSSDATHITKPSAPGQMLSMNRALRDATLAPGQISHINSHGTATRAGDVVEAQSIRGVFADHTKIPVTATKSSHGHLIGAAGAVEFIVTILALRHSLIPATVFWSKPDPECDLDVVRLSPRAMPEGEFAMSNSFAFGGSNATLIAGRWKSEMLKRIDTRSLGQRTD
jgi:3-oxoacyl-[acyl-carrier-protein] synthase II